MCLYVIMLVVYIVLCDIVLSIHTILSIISDSLSDIKFMSVLYTIFCAFYT